MMRTIVSAFAFSMLSATPAFAHAMLVRADPAVGATVQEAPQTLRLEFSDPVEPEVSHVEVEDAAHRPIATAGLTSANEGFGLTAELRHPLPPGVYRVRWRVTSLDAHDIQGVFTFSVHR
jgi:methionine-rich copper-binding protein CopC